MLPGSEPRIRTAPPARSTSQASSVARPSSSSEADLGLDGHSDADVLTHAIMDALLGAAGLDDIGVHFPDTDEDYEGADSIVLLKEVHASLRARGLCIVHIDSTLILERPKIGPYRAAIRESLAAALGLDRRCVNVKASTGEGLGFIGRVEGAAALAVVTLRDEVKEL